MKEAEQVEEMRSPEVEKKPGRLIVITGPSAGAGKDKIAGGVEEGGGEEFARIITYTTRDKRPGEVEGEELHFITVEEFLEKERSGFFLETNRLDTGDWYGSPKEEVLQTVKQGKVVLLRVDLNGAKEIKEERCPEAVTIFIYATLEEMRKRLIKRGRDSKEKIENKLDLAARELREKDADYIDYCVHNQDDKLEEAIKQVLEIIEKEKKN